MSRRTIRNEGTILRKTVENVRGVNLDEVSGVVSMARGIKEGEIGVFVKLGRTLDQFRIDGVYGVDDPGKRW